MQNFNKYVTALFSTCLFLFLSALNSAEIAIVTIAAGEEYREAVKLGLKNKQDYCIQRGYDFVCGDKTLDPTRTIHWSKILLILKTMENEKYQWIFWTDADALIMNTGLFIEDLIDENYNLIINNDYNGFNSGHFLIRNCEWSRRFLRDAYTHTEFVDHGEWDQGALLAALQENKEYLALTKTVPQRLMNSFPDALGILLQATYQPGDFILHFAGIRDTGLLQSYFQYYYPMAGNLTSILTYEHYLGIHDVIGLPKHSAFFNWSTDAQNTQYESELAKCSEVRTVAQIGLSDGNLAEIFFTNCPKLTKFLAYVKNKRYNPMSRASCDYLSRKYRLKWEEDTSGKITPSETPFDLIHIQSHSIDKLIQARGLADQHTRVWINDYNLPDIQQIVAEAVERDLLEIGTVHRSGEHEDYRAWIEARYKF